MKIAIIRFPGSNCDQDALHSLRDDLGMQAEYVWHEETSLRGFEGIFIPGGFSYGDYLRCGAMASRAPVMDEVRRFAREGRPVIGVCNGFQILCEAGILPGALLLNEEQKFICEDVFLRAENRSSIWTRDVDRTLRIPIAHGEGRYVCEPETLSMLQDRDLIAFRYATEQGEVHETVNVNGSTDAIAGVLNRQGNVLGMMPHPERATREVLGNTDGRLILGAFAKVPVAL
jgi:phosphoribosylformylglycinamidine synthase I